MSGNDRGTLVKAHNGSVAVTQEEEQVLLGRNGCRGSFQTTHGHLLVSASLNLLSFLRSDSFKNEENFEGCLILPAAVFFVRYHDTMIKPLFINLLLE